MARNPHRRLVLLCLAAALCVGGCGDSPNGPSRPASLSQLSVSPATVGAGATSEGTATLSGQAPSGGFEVTISTSDGVAIVPATVTVPGGATTGTFTIRTRLVAADTSVMIRASAGDERREAVLRVTAPVPRPATLLALEIEPSAFRGGQNAQGTVRLTGAAPAAGSIVNLRSSNAAATVPNSVTVPSGAVSAMFTVTTRPVSLETQFEITATFGDQTRTVPIRLTP